MFNPFSVTGAVNDAKKNRSLGKSVVVNVVAGALLLVASVISFGVTGGVNGAVTGVLLGVVTLVALLVSQLVLGWVFSLAVDVIGGKGSLYEGFTSLTYPTYVLALGWLVASVLGLLNLVVPLLGSGLASLVGLVFGAIGVATFFRVTKELFALDYVATLLAVAVLSLALVFAGSFVGASVATSLAGSVLAGGNSLNALGPLGSILQPFLSMIPTSTAG